MSTQTRAGERAGERTPAAQQSHAPTAEEQLVGLRGRRAALQRRLAFAVLQIFRTARAEKNLAMVRQGVRRSTVQKRCVASHVRHIRVTKRREEGCRTPRHRQVRGGEVCCRSRVSPRCRSLLRGEACRVRRCSHQEQRAEARFLGCSSPPSDSPTRENAHTVLGGCAAQQCEVGCRLQAIPGQTTPTSRYSLHSRTSFACAAAQNLSKSTLQPSSRSLSAASAACHAETSMTLPSTEHSLERTSADLQA